MEDREMELYRRTVEVYLKYGIKNVTMDLMSRELKISKKTLYKYVDDRRELVAKSMYWKLLNDSNAINNILAKKLNAIEEFYQIINFQHNNLLSTHPFFYFDLKKFYHDTWIHYMEHRKAFLYDVVLSNILKGIQEGLYKEDFNIKVVAKFYLSKDDKVFDSDIFSAGAFSFSEVYDTMARYHLSGIVSEYGLRKMNLLNLQVVKIQKELISDLAIKKYLCNTEISEN